MFSAISQGIQLGYKEFRILCGTGGRVDHSFANIQILAYLANRQMQGFLIDRNAVLTVIKDSEYTFDISYTGYVSIFSISDNSHIKLINSCLEILSDIFFIFSISS